MNNLMLSLVSIILLTSMIACNKDTELIDETTTIVDPTIETEGLDTSNGILEVAALPDLPNFPTNNPQSIAKQELGRALFWDPILSGNLEVACASCHHPDEGYGDGLERSRGINGSLLDRNAPTIINTAFNGIALTTAYDPLTAPMFWDSRTFSLEDQALVPVLSAVEMRGNDIPETEILDVVIQRINNISEYQDLFSAAFGTPIVTSNRIAQALATFQRGVVSNNSRFDQYMRGNDNILSPLEINGLETFITVGCADCHSGAMFSDYELHTLSVPNNGIDDPGATGNYDFRTPTLRNIELTGPYMHNGEFQSLNQVLNFYNDISRGNGNSQNNNVNNNQIAQEARNLNLNNGQVNQIVAFLRTLTDQDFDDTVPTRVPSNLVVGGQNTP